MTTGGRVVLVCGATSGIGSACVRRLVDRGDQPILLARGEARLQDAASSVPDDPLLLACDIVDDRAVSGAIEAVLARYGRLDAVIHTAQVMAYGSIVDLPADAFDRCVDVALRGTANLARAVIPVFARQRRGSLVIVNSLLAEIPVPTMGAYCTAKWGQLGLARTLQLETRHLRGVAVSIVSPGAVDTPIYRAAANYTGRRVGPPPPVVDPDRVARAALRCVDRPRRHVEVGPVNRPAALGYRAVPAVYDRVVGPMARLLVTRRAAAPHTAGNLHAPSSAPARERDGWNRWGLRRR